MLLTLLGTPALLVAQPDPCLPVVLFQDSVTWLDLGEGQYEARLDDAPIYRGTFDVERETGVGTFAVRARGEVDLDSATWTGTWFLEAGRIPRMTAFAEVVQWEGDTPIHYRYQDRVLQEVNGAEEVPLRGHRDILYLDGSAYSGSWKQGRKHGQGRIRECHCLQGNWEGGWKDGVPHGLGREVHLEWEWTFKGRKSHGDWSGAIHWYPEAFMEELAGPLTVQTRGEEMTLELTSTEDLEVVPDIAQAFHHEVDDLRQFKPEVVMAEWAGFVAEFQVIFDQLLSL